MDNYEKVRAYHKKFSLPLDMGFPPDEIVANRLRFISSEFEELKEATANKNRVEIMHELADLLAVCYGMAAEFGFDINEVFNRVVASNMTKDKPLDGIGKLVKGPSFKPVDLSDLA